MTENLTILGSGPAGLTAAIYAARGNLAPLVLTGQQIGGQIATTDEVENYPGFPEGITGPELVDLMQKQATKLGARLVLDTVTEVNFRTSPFEIKAEDGTVHLSKSVIVATGASPKRLGVPGEEEFLGRGVSYCATCDGFFFRGKDIAVIGGGDSALQEALFLTRFASRVYLIHRRDQLRAQAILQERAFRNDKITMIWNSTIAEINGSQKVETVVLANTTTGQLSELVAQGVFVYIGHSPNTKIFRGQLQMDPAGYVCVDDYLHTSVPGVFAAGEVHDHIYRQAIVSAGYGCMAELEAERYLANL